MKRTYFTPFTKFILLWAVCMLAILPSSKAQTVEDGTAERPFLIENEQELWDFHECMVPGTAFYFDYHTGTYTSTKPSGTVNVDYKNMILS